MPRSKAENEKWAEIMQSEEVDIMPLGINAFFTEEAYVDDFGENLGRDVLTKACDFYSF